MPRIYPLIVKRIISGGGGPNPTDAFSLNIKTVDSNAAPTDAATFLVNLLEADSNVAPTETLKLNINGLGDTNAAPVDAQSFLVRIWLSGSVGTSNVTNPTNANGANNGTVSSQQTAAAGATSSTLTSALGSNVPSGITFSSAIYRGWFKDANTLGTSFGQVQAHSTSALFADIVMFANNTLNSTVDHLVGDFTFDLLAAGVNTVAKLQSLQIRHVTSDTVAGVTPNVLTVDAGALDIAGVF